MQSRGLTCEVCTQPYNLTTRTPHVLATCGHTVCHMCFANMTQRYLFPTCPFDGTSFSYNTYLGPPNNHSLMLILEDNHFRSNNCDIHDQPIRFTCLEDGQNICTDCVIYGYHKGHEVKLLTEIAQEAELKEAKLEHDIETYKHHLLQEKKIIDQTQAFLLQGMRQRFKEMRSILESKEFEITARINGVIHTKAKKVDEILQISPSLRGQLKAKNEEYKEQLQRNEYWKIIEDDTSQIDKQTETTLLKKRLCSYAEEMGKIVDFDEIIRTELKPLVPDIEGSIRNIIQDGFVKNKKLKTSSSYLSKQLSDTEPNKNLIELPGIFKFKIDQKCLIVSFKNNTRNDPIMVNLQEWEEANLNKIKFQISRYDVLLEKENLDTVLFLRNWSKSIYRLQVIFDPKGITDDFLLTFFPVIFANLNDIKHIQIYLENCNTVGDRSLNVLFGDILPITVDKLTFIGLSLDSTCVTDEALDKLVEKTLKPMKKLKSFALDLSNTKPIHLTEFGVLKIFIAMESITTYYLHLGNKRLEDNIINTFIQNTLSTMKKLKSLTLCLGSTEVGDTSIVPLFNQLKTHQLRELTVQLDRTNVTNQSLIKSIECVNELSQSLEFVDISSEDSYASAKYVKKIEELCKNYGSKDN